MSGIVAEFVAFTGANPAEAARYLALPEAGGELEAAVSLYFEARDAQRDGGGGGTKTDGARRPGVSSSGGGGGAHAPPGTTLPSAKRRRTCPQGQEPGGGTGVVVVPSDGRPASPSVEMGAAGAVAASTAG